MASSATLQDIVRQMGTAPDNSTLNWDVVVNYKYVCIPLIQVLLRVTLILHILRESEINELLANSWSNDPESHIQHLFA